MSKKTIINVILLICCWSFTIKAQTKAYPYKRQLTGIKDNWHLINLPNQLFEHTQPELADLRIYASKGKDTVEIPYIIKLRNNKVKVTESQFNLMNQSVNNNAYYYTIQPSTASNLNQIKLAFKQSNFDWKVTLEGSNDAKEWYKILNDYRIIAIQNKATNYQFTDLNFATTKYNFYRIAIKANEQPELKEVKIIKTDTLDGIYKDVLYQTYQLTNVAETKQSIIQLALPTPAPVSSLQLLIASKTDYYRNISIAYATDSFETEKGLQYNYTTIYNGTLSSLEKPVFELNSTLIKHIKITIDNEDNQPLRINGVKLKAPVYQLIARFDEPYDDYALYYGNKKASPPNYEVKNFEDKIPVILNEITLGKELKNPSSKPSKDQPIFENKAWLWALMGLIISLLGFFAFKMLKE